jgi:two-component system NtrC family response regulator
VAEQARQKLLIVEDDLGLQRQLKWCFDDYEVLLASNRSEALAEQRRHEAAVVLQDLGLPPDAGGVSEGLATLAEIMALTPHCKVIVVTGNDDRENAIGAVGAGAYDFYQKPLDTDILGLVVRRAFRMHELEAENRALQMRRASSPLQGVIATDEVMLRVCRAVEKVAPTSASAMLLGESGTGKELLARAIHARSERRAAPFVAINCAAIPDTLLESELFGYEKGAFTGAVKLTPGKIEYANRGTLFLDEIGDMPTALQAKLLRFLQERTIERIGGREPIALDVRIVCATNQDLAALTATGRFRQDLFYRLSEVVINIPPLRERRGDSLVIAQHLLEQRAREHRRPIRGYADDAVDAILGYAWPGNVRELENKVNGAVIMADGKQVTAADLGLPPAEPRSTFLNLRVARQNAERQVVRSALAVANGNLSRAAELLGVTRPTLYDLIGKTGLDPAGSSTSAPAKD